MKKDNKIRERDELMDEEQIINEKKIIFPIFCGAEMFSNLNTKEAIKQYIFDYINSEFQIVKNVQEFIK